MNSTIYLTIGLFFSYTVHRTDIRPIHIPHNAQGLHFTMSDRIEIIILSCLETRQNYVFDPIGHSEMQPRLYRESSDA